MRCDMSHSILLLEGTLRTLSIFLAVPAAPAVVPAAVAVPAAASL